MYEEQTNKNNKVTGVLHLAQEDALKRKVVARIKRGTRGMDACEAGE